MKKIDTWGFIALAMGACSLALSFWYPLAAGLFGLAAGVVGLSLGIKK